MPNLQAVASYFLSAMNSFYPQANHHFYERSAIIEERYHQLAQDIAEVVFDPNVEPLFAGESGRTETGLLLLAIAGMESRYRKDNMICETSGDNGHAWGIFQLHWSKSQACGSVRVQSLQAMSMIRNSFHVCHYLSQVDHLSAFTDGNDWRTKEAHHRSEDRMNLAIEWLGEHPTTDKEVSN